MENFHLCNQCGATKKQIKVSDYVYFYYCEDYCYGSHLEREIGCMYEDHEYTDHVWTTVDNRKVVSSICKFCGHKRPGGLKSSKEKDKLPNADKLLARYDLLEKQSYELYAKKRDAYSDKVREIQKAKWRDFYGDYISSAEWLNKRQLVLKRDNNICQACLINKAEEVHHKTYDNLGNEFMFELISVCKKCHDRIHNK